MNIGWVTNPSSFTGTTFGGAGAKTIGSGTSASYALAGTISMTNTTFAGGGLAGTFTLNGTLAWTGGEMITTGGVGAPVVTVATGSTLALSGIFEKTLSGAGASLVNNGTISIAGNGNLRVENNASLTNSAAGTIDLQSDAGITQSGGATSTLTNAGLVTKSGGAGTSSITLASVTNNGNMQAQSGTLLISRNGGLTLQASGPGNAFNAQAGAALTIGWVGSANLTDTTFGGPGAKTIGTVGVLHTWTGTITATNTTIIEGLHSGTFTLNGTLNWDGGQLVGTSTPLQLTIPAGATLIARTSSQKILSGNNPTLARITNGGTLRLAGTNGIEAQGTPQIVNLPSGLIEFASTAGLSKPLCCNPSIANAGTMRLAPGAGSVTVSDWSIANTGTISLQAGTLQFFGAPNTFAQTAGKLELVGGNMSTTRPLPITGGQLTGTGAISGSGAVTVSGSAQTRPGTSPGQITIGGAYTQTGTLVAELNGPAPGTQYDQVVASGAVALGGTLSVSLGAVPAVGTVFRIIDNHRRRGHFRRVRRPAGGRDVHGPGLDAADQLRGRRPATT